MLIRVLRFALLALPCAPLGAQWRVDPKPVVEIGGEGDEYVFTNVISSIVRLSNGHIVVVDQWQDVRVFDASGKFVRRIGRKGDGPGEFRAPFWAAVGRGDTLYVYDYSEGPGKLNVFAPSGAFVRAAIVLAMPEAFATKPLHLLPNGVVLFTGSVQSSYPPNKQRPYRGENALIRYSFADSVKNIMRYPGQILEVPWRPWQFDGHIAASDSVVFVGDGTTASIKVHALDGKLRRDGRLPLQPPRVTDADKDDWLKRMNALAESGNENRKASIARQIARTEFPELAPPYTTWMTDAAGYLWVGPPPTARDAARSQYRVFDASLRQVARATLPDGFTPIEIGRDFVAGMVRDSDDVPRIRIHRLMK